MIRRALDALVPWVALTAIAHLGCGQSLIMVVPHCDMSFALGSEEPRPGDRLTVTAFVDIESLTGFRTFDWTVEFDGETIDFEEVSADGDTIEFIAAQPGAYTIGLDGTVGGVECTGIVRDDIAVVAEGARPETFVLRVIPPAGVEVPAQDKEVVLYGGAGYPLGTINLVPGANVAGISRDPDGAPIPAYLRASREPLGGAPPLLGEAAAGEDGAYALRLLLAEHDLLVVPRAPDRAPYLLAGLSATSIPALSILTPGEPITGTILDGDGQPVAGTRIALEVGGVPSAIGLSDETGAFALEARAGGPVAISATPPDESGLPRLELPPIASPISPGGAAIEIRYAAALSARAVSPVVRRSDGATPAPGSRVTWIARPIAAAATIALDGAPPHEAVGVVRQAAEAGAGGALPELVLPDAIYDVVIEPPPDEASEAVSLTILDLEAGAPATLDLTPPGELRGRILLADGQTPLAGARVQAAPRGLLTGATRAGASARTDANGRFTLLVAGAADYELSADGGSRGQGRARWLVTAPTAGDIVDLEPTALPKVLRREGALGVEGRTGPLAGAHVQLFCTACGPGETAVPVAEAITDPAGNFELIAPDPGVEPEE
jgi:hypothetical protein